MSGTVLITGANRGLGLELAKSFLADKAWHVLAAARTTSPVLERLAEESENHLTPVSLDVSSMESVRKAAAFVSGKTTGLDILINNAAVCSDSDLSIPDTDFEQVEIMMDVNAVGSLRVIHQFLPLIEKGNEKLIINISSEAGSLSGCWRDFQIGYCMSKAAMNMQTRILEKYLSPKGIRIAAIHPGWMRTDMGGPGADIHPSEAAAGIMDLVTSRREIPVYGDYDGTPREW